MTVLFTTTGDAPKTALIEDEAELAALKREAEQTGTPYRASTL